MMKRCEPFVRCFDLRIFTVAFFTVPYVRGVTSQNRISMVHILTKLQRSAKIKRSIQFAQERLGVFAILKMSTVALSIMFVLVAEGFPENPFAQDKGNPPNRFAKEIKQFGITPDEESARTYLQSLIPSEENRRLADQLIQKLNSPSFDVRETATNQLVSLPNLSSKHLELLRDNPDPEVAYRGNMVLKTRAKQLEVAQRTFFLYLANEDQYSLTREILDSYNHLASDSAKYYAGQAIERTATKDDMQLLRDTISPNTVPLAVHCLAAIKRIDGDAAIEVIRKTKDNIGPIYKLRAAEIFAERANPECLQMFVDLLEDESKQNVNGRAFSRLRAMTKKSFEYKTLSSIEDRKKSAAKWRRWIDENANKIEITLSRKTPMLGRTLVSHYTENKVSCIDESGNELWTAKGQNPFACQGLPSGNCVVAMYSAQKVVEFDPRGKIVKTFSGLPSNISGLHRLENGNTLLACGQAGNKILELDPEGKQIWEITVKGTPTGVRMLDSGLLLVSLYGSKKVAEIDRKGTIVREFSVEKSPYTANRLENGNTLVSFATSGIAEYDPEGKQVWKTSTDDNCYWAQVLDDDTVVTADENGIKTFDRKGNVIKKDTRAKGYVYIHRY